MNIKRHLNLRTLFILLPFLIAFFVFLAVKLAVGNPELVEKYYSRGLYPAISTALSALSNIIPFSLWDISWIMMIVLLLAGLLLVISGTITLKWYFIRILQFTMVFYSLFYLLWGFNYFRPGLESRMGWQRTKADEKTFRSVLSLLIDNANINRSKIDHSQYSELNLLVEDSYRKNSNLLKIDYYQGQRRPKTMLLSSYFAKSEVSGYFGPLFNEVHVNYYLLPLDYPFTLAHEKAHQLGFANEAEANMIAFIVCSSSSDLRLQYSASLHMLLYFLNDAHYLPDYKEILKKLDDGVINDIMMKQDYYEKLSDKNLSRLQEKANDIYLKSNRIDKGVRNYNQVVGLVLSWYNNLTSGKVEVVPGFAQTMKK